MQVKLLKSLVREVAGTDAEAIIDILFNKKDVSEFLIGKKMGLSVNQARNILYKLYAEGLVTSTRKKDKRKGWFIYYWTLKTDKCLEKLEVSLLKKIEQLKNLLESRESKRFYTCKICGVEVSEEKALEHNFTCEECGEVYTLMDNSKIIRKIKAKIGRAERELKIIRNELKAFKEKEAKKKAKAEKARKTKEKVKKEKKKDKKVTKKTKKVKRKKVVKKVKKKK